MNESFPVRRRFPREHNSYLTRTSCRVSGLCVCESMFLFYDIGFSCFTTDNKGHWLQCSECHESPAVSKTNFINVSQQTSQTTSKSLETKLELWCLSLRKHFSFPTFSILIELSWWFIDVLFLLSRHFRLEMWIWWHLMEVLASLSKTFKDKNLFLRWVMMRLPELAYRPKYKTESTFRQ